MSELQQQQQYHQEESQRRRQQQQQLEEQYKAIFLNFQKTGICSAELSSSSSSTSSVTLVSGGLNGPNVGIDGGGGRSSSMSIGSGPSAATVPMDSAQSVHSFHPYCISGSGTDMSTHHPHHQQPQQKHHRCHNAEPWRQGSAFVMVPKKTTTTTTFDSYGLVPGFSYGPNYYQAPSGHVCPVGLQYGFYATGPPDSQLMHHHQPLTMLQQHHHHHEPIVGELMNRRYIDGKEVRCSVPTAEPEKEPEVKPETETAPPEDTPNNDSPNNDSPNNDSPDNDSPNNDSTILQQQSGPDFAALTSEDTGGDVIVDDVTLGIVEYECVAQKEEEKSSSPTRDSIESDGEGDGATKLKRGSSTDSASMLPAFQASIYRPASEFCSELAISTDYEEISVGAHDAGTEKSSELLRGLVCTSEIGTSPDSSGTSPDDCSSKSSFEGTRKKRKKPIYVVKNYLTPHQVEVLEAKFQESPFLSDAKGRMALADEIELSEHKIGVWFQNRRTKERRHGRMPAGPLPKDYDHKRYNKSKRK